MGQRRLVESKTKRLRDIGAGGPGGRVLLCLCDGRAWRRMEGQGFHVHPRPRIPHHWAGRLLRAWFRQNRVFRGRYGQGSQELDRSIDRFDARPAKSLKIQLGESEMRRLRRCKSIATLGPSSANPAMISALFHAGADLFRINMSHTTHDQMRGQAGMIRTLQEECGRPIGILLDLQGPKPRIGTFKDRAVQLVKDANFVFDLDPAPGGQNRVGLPHPEILRSLKPGHTILIADGKVRLHVTEASASRAVAIVDVAGEISNRKGVSLPDTEIPVSSITGKDRADLKAGLDAGIDWVAVSFVRRPEDVAEVKKLTLDRALVMAKLEKPHAISRLDEIVAVSDALMVARGDLGVAARKSSGLAKADQPHGAPVRQACRSRDANARIDDQRARADTRGSFGCRDRGLRGRRCRHAFRRKRGWFISRGSRRDHE